MPQCLDTSSCRRIQACWVHLLSCPPPTAPAIEKWWLSSVWRTHSHFVSLPFEHRRARLSQPSIASSVDCQQEIPPAGGIAEWSFSPGRAHWGVHMSQKWKRESVSHSSHCASSLRDLQWPLKPCFPMCLLQGMCPCNTREVGNRYVNRACCPKHSIRKDFLTEKHRLWPF